MKLLERKSAVAETKSKYAQTIASIRQRSETPDAAASVEPGQGRGRPPGKRSNPEWKLYSHYLKKQTQREATNILRNEEDGRDLSDVLQELLADWIAQHKNR
jgi:hypothetical protein